MALEACFQLTPSTSPSAPRTCALHAQNPKKIKLLPTKEPKGALSSPTLIQLPSSQDAVEDASLLCHATNAVDEVLEVSDDNWKELVSENKIPLVVVDFWGPSCGPCKMVEPVMDELAKDYTGKIAVTRSTPTIT